MPSLSAALAVIVVVEGAVKTVPAVGLVMLTVGFALTTTATAVDVVVAPRLSVAIAVNE